VKPKSPTVRPMKKRSNLSMFLLPTLLVSALFLLLMSCTRSIRDQGPDRGPYRSSLREGFLKTSGSIAFTGTDGNIYVLDVASGKGIQLTNDAAPGADRRVDYRYPAWSFDGSKLAFIGYRLLDDGDVESTLYVSDPADRGVASILTSRKISPFYLYWSPDAKRISFLSTSGGGDQLLLFVIGADGGEPEVVDSGQPLYWSWRKDGSSILTHTGGSALEQREKALIKRFDLSTADREGVALYYFPALFQAPEHSPDGEALLIAASMYGLQSTLVLATRDGEPQQLITDWQGPLSFSWSPKGNRIAFITGQASPIGGIIGTLNILGMADDAAEAAYKAAQGIFAYFWSPDGKKIALFEPTIVGGPSVRPILMLNVSILFVESGELWYRTSILPTPSFLGQVVPFFDQYQRSHTIWSPDSTHIVVSGFTADKRPGIFVVPADGEAPPQLVAFGHFPFWSWQ
jgi:dipeptidyl aminopeptidase/acylaminoacyl peptidase